jgi:hypothetical protein
MKLIYRIWYYYLVTSYIGRLVSDEMNELMIMNKITKNE